MSIENPGARSNTRHVVMGLVVGIDSDAFEATLRTPQGRKVTCSHLTGDLVDRLAERFQRTVVLAGWATWGANGALVGFRPVCHLECDAGFEDPAGMDKAHVVDLPLAESATTEPPVRAREDA